MPNKTLPADRRGDAAAFGPSFEILLVEDQIRHRRIYEEALTDELPVRVRHAGTGDEAVLALGAETPPDLVVLDLEIPGMRGEDLLVHIKGDVRLRYIPVIILTGLSGYEKQLELLDKGADDFIEKGGSPAILIARIKAQMRHKLAVDRLERLALDRDLFAAGVLQDIGLSKWTIVSLCRQAKDVFRRDPAGDQTELRHLLDKLSAHASKLGTYASDIIQSVRETHRNPVVAKLEVGHLLAWVAEVLAPEPQAGAATVPLPWHAPTPLVPVVADKSFLRLALLHVVQFAVAHARPDVALTLTVTQQEHDDPADPRGRRYVTTRIADNGRGLAGLDPSQIFMPYLSNMGATTGTVEDAGSTIGLALVAKVMGRMGGRVWAEPAATGSGTVMCLDLPLA